MRTIKELPISHVDQVKHVLGQCRARQIIAHDPELLIAISSSGKSKNIINALSTDKTMMTMTFTGFAPENRVRKTGKVNFYTPSYDYGIVEVAHQLILHNITDRLKAMNKANKVAAE